jgi:myo-inositol-1(or 4)-monophosphatase
MSLTTSSVQADLPALLATARRAAAAGSAIVRAGIGAAREVESKGPGDWVSEVDIASENAVRAVLLSEWPDLPVLGEEEGGERGAVSWIVDPLDGTTNFLHAFPAVGVSIGLVEGDTPIVAVVDAPLLGETYSASLGGGAFRNGTPLRVSERAPGNAVCVTGFPFRNKERLDSFLATFERVLRSIEDIRRVGSASLDLCWTGAGVFDGYFELSLGPWDVAAGALIVREAGGVVTDWWGDETAWLRTGDVLAAPPRLHEHLLTITRDFRP